MANVWFSKILEFLGLITIENIYLVLYSDIIERLYS